MFPTPIRREFRAKMSPRVESGTVKPHLEEKVHKRHNKSPAPIPISPLIPAKAKIKCR
jgi:hypothetical protein